MAGGAWSVRVYVKPLVRWIWLGALMIAFGGGIAALDKRYRPAPTTRSPSAAAVDLRKAAGKSEVAGVQDGAI